MNHGCQSHTKWDAHPNQETSTVQSRSCWQSAVAPPFEKNEMVMIAGTKSSVFQKGLLSLRAGFVGASSCASCAVLRCLRQQDGARRCEMVRDDERWCEMARVVRALTQGRDATACLLALSDKTKTSTPRAFKSRNPWNFEQGSHYVKLSQKKMTFESSNWNMTSVSKHGLNGLSTRNF